jgi:hypothetical protein
MKRKSAAQILMALALTTGLAGHQVYADPPPWAPAHGKRAKQQHAYTYYPDYGFYYSPETRMWFWLEGSDWRIGASLPLDYERYATGGVSIELGTERPYEEHNLVVERYGKPKKVKHKKEK